MLSQSSNTIVAPLFKYSVLYNLRPTLEMKKAFYLEVRLQYNDNKFTKIERSAVFIFLNKTCFRGMYRVNGKGFFNVPFGNYKKPKIITELIELAELSFFIKDVIFKRLDFMDAFNLLKKNDFVYLDPPYMPENANSFVKYTSSGFSLQQHFLLFTKIKQLQSKNILFLLHNSKINFVKQFFKDFFIEEFQVKRRINALFPNSVTKEIIVFNNRNLGSRRFFSTQRGLPFENSQVVNLSRYYEQKEIEFGLEIEFYLVRGKKILLLKKKGFIKYMRSINQVNLNVFPAHGCKEPDMVLIYNKFMFILEIRSQNVSGSTAEKLQTADFKRSHFEKRYPNYTIIYIFILSG